MLQSLVMRLDKLSLLNFRNHVSKTLTFDPVTTVIVGANASGKTNILEAIGLLATGESFRGGKIEEMVNWQAEVGHVAGLIINQSENIKYQTSNIKDEEHSVDIQLQVTVNRGVVLGRRVMKRRLMVNGVARSKQKFVGHLTTVTFRPEDMRIIEGSPGRRRSFLDEILIQADFEYARCLNAYNRALIRRNKLLEMIREGKAQPNSLLFWNQLIIKNGELIQKKRKHLAENFNQGRETYNLPTTDELIENLMLNYDCSVISPARLDQYADREVYAGHTLVGPHRDDFIIEGTKEWVGNGHRRDLAVYGSRGEQRLGVLWLKLRALEYLKQHKGYRPLLLLDDIFSELDHQHRELVLSLLGRQQTIVTAADKHNIETIRNATIVDF